jgi:hypothetical protein
MSPETEIVDSGAIVEAANFWYEGIFRENGIFYSFNV